MVCVTGHSSLEDGKIPFVSATDIAAVVFRELIDEKPHNTSYHVLGPEILTYDQVHRLFGSETRISANADRLHAGCDRMQQRSGTRNCACQNLQSGQDYLALKKPRWPADRIRSWTMR